MSVPLHAHVEGQGEDLVLLHGLFGSGRNWLGLQRALAAHRRVHALDLRNHGQSPWADAMDYPTMAADVAAYCREHCGETVALVGHSMGGKVAMTLALQALFPLSGLVVVDIAPVPNPPTLAPVLAAMRAVDPSRTARRQQVAEWLAADVPDERVRAFLLQNLVANDGGLRWRINLEAIARAMPDILDFPALPGHTAFAGRTCFIVGADSDYVTAAHEDAIRLHFPRARIETIADAGHWVHADQPARFLETLSTALA